MPDYDPIEFGNDNPFVKRDGIIVAFLSHSGRSSELRAKSDPNIQTFLVPWTMDPEDEDIILICGVTPQDALEALRRKEPQVAAKVEAGTLPMWRRPPLEEVKV